MCSHLKSVGKCNNEFIFEDFPLRLAIVTGFWMVIDRHKLAVSDTETIIGLYRYFTVMLIIWTFKIKSALKTYAQMSLI